MNEHKSFLRVLALAVSLVLTFSIISLPVFAENGGCTHDHDETCGYAEETPCGYIHEHDETCGYNPETGDGCTDEHIHDEDCGYNEEVPCGHEHDENCGGLPHGGPDDAECVCESPCDEDAINGDCPICADDADGSGDGGETPNEFETMTGVTTTSPSAITVTAFEPLDAITVPLGTAEDELDLGENTPLADGLAYSFDDLLTMLSESGTVTLGADITVPEDESLDLDREIYTGEYGIIVDGYLALREGAVITGEGVSRPVIEVTAGGGLGVHGYDYESAPRVAATGDGGLGILFREGSYGSHTNPGGFLRISASGAEAAAIQAEESLSLVRHFIEAPDGIGIICPEDVSLFLCQINAGTAAIDAPSFTADTSVLSPDGGAGGTYINRKIIQDSYIRVFVKQGETVPAYNAGWSEFPVTLRAEGYEDEGAMLGATVKLPEIDTGVTGIYPMPVELDECWAAFDLLPEDVTLMAAEVYDPEIPYFKDASNFFGVFYVDYFYEGDMNGLTLWRSDDGGESWYDYTDGAELDYSTGYMVTLPFYEQPEHPVRLVWEAEGIGESEVLRLSWDGGFSGDFGGDRIGVGRGEVELPPTASAPKPEPEPSAPPNRPYDDSDDDTLITPPIETNAPETTPDADILSDALKLALVMTPETPSVEMENAAGAVTETPIPPLETPADRAPPEAVTPVEASDTPTPAPASVSQAPSMGNAPAEIIEESPEPEPAQGTNVRLIGGAVFVCAGAVTGFIIRRKPVKR